ncbi:hypothetical protein IW15_14980 [Chryseobacterium soli]|uniref:Grasp-with-spasm system SPASM domain peptide maturase n=1 Tax=Chryseobacterium soli TaxID=445961 RepID=A0A086A4A2_9FLAO|nr:grasp-with-spasm system SPASM domain peptide maturase [Chryseobacterium soli]KFF11516.1 hypothetical protein IW15_14980 [Chryseobacterium soli]
MKNFFELYQDCFIVKGAKNILLCDFHFNKILNITDFYHLFVDDYYIPIINNDELESVSYFVDEKFGTITDTISPKGYRKQFKWRSPNKINEVIIEHKIRDNFNLQDVYMFIEDLSSTFIQIRFLEFSFSKFKKILSLIEFSCIRTAELILPYTDLTQSSKVINLLKQNFRIKVVYFYNSPENKSIVDNKRLFTMIYYEKDLINPKYCGVISEDYFLNDLNNISKNKTVNSCLYGKLFISNNGDLKNCPAMQNVLENFNTISAKSLIPKINEEKERFITKDQIEICRDCEYRYFCIDCRAYKENPENIFSKPLKCGYDPYKGIWEEWSKNPLKQKAIKYYDLESFT